MERWRAGAAATAEAAGADGPEAVRPAAFAGGAGSVIVPPGEPSPRPGQSRNVSTAVAKIRQHKMATTSEPPAPRLGASPRARNVQTIPIGTRPTTRRVA